MHRARRCACRARSEIRVSLGRYDEAETAASRLDDFFEYVKARVAVVKDVETFGAARDLSWFVVCASTETRDTLFPVECYHLEKMDHDEAFGYDREREENKLVIPDAYK